jgi:hypothetical protein
MASARKLPRHLRIRLGPDAGADLVTILDEIRADHARSQAKFDEFRREVLQRFEHVERRFEHVERRFDEIDRRFERVDERFIAVLEKVSDVQSNLMKWSFVFWCGAVAAIAALAGVLQGN